MLEYPKEFPSEALMILADKLRGKAVDTATAIRGAWVVLGWGLNNFTPDKQPAIIGAGIGITESAEEQAKFIEEFTGVYLDDKERPRQMGIGLWFLIRIAIGILSKL